MKKLMLSETWLYRYRFVFGYSVLIVTCLFTLLYRLGDLLPGINSLEADTAAKSMSVVDLLKYPVDFIYHLLQYASISSLGPSAFALRLPGVILAGLTLTLFFYIVENRFSKRAAIVSTLLLVSSSWFLNFARLGTTSTLTVFLVLLLFFLSIKLNQKHSRFWLLLLVSAAALSVYSPYFIYLLVTGVLLSYPSLRAYLKVAKNRDLYLALALFTVLVLPLIFSAVNNFEIAKELLVLPDRFPNPSEYLQNIFGVVGHVIWRSEAFPVLHLGTLPMLEIFSVSMVALGLYHYDHELSRHLSRLVLGGVVVVIALLAVNGDQSDYALLLPFVYFVLAGGLVILFTQWNEIFPKNPLARLIAVVPISILLFIVGSYHVERYFVAWPNTPQVTVEHSEAYVKINDELDNNATNTSVISSSTETRVLHPLEIHYKNVSFVADISDVAETSEERRLIITDKAYAELSKESKKSLDTPSRIVPSAYTSQAATLWIFDISL